MSSISKHLAAMTLTAFGLAAHADDQPALERWRSYAGVSWEQAPNGADPVAFAGSVKAPIAGIHFDGQGAAYVSTPRLLSDGAPATISRLDTGGRTGPARLTAFPSLRANDITAPVQTSLRNVLGFHVDRRNGWLWALDLGFVAAEQESPPGAQKVLVLDLASGRVVKCIPLDGVADRKASFLNDIAVDEHRRVAYLSDSGLRSAPDNAAGLIVVDFASGRSWRVLDRHPSLMPRPGVQVVAHGRDVWPGHPMMLGINGIALSPDAAVLYWSVTTGTHVYSVPTALLRDPQTGTGAIAAHVRDLGDVGGNTDGIVTDAAGALYITDVTHNGIVRYDPTTAAMARLASSDGVHWPDTVAIHPNGDLVFTASKLDQHFAGAVKNGDERYELWRLPLQRAGQARP
ncbi:L-dopachrome tautomerase-related protein [Xylophilus sp. GOD-11R]|uniref:L-dopachrome tautomerase-related protein n=1 Tax=Xylophilus sp. GOD-11R TaxID=3089814 RepID=UPI00298C650A|nr:L-dopachrome tautomerase-related protein [Xylophilus sp. GOD-11R]WPB58063.1 L-dopachrome tautomerase-related protein [Xylophilus sp. GOD-11R]